MRSVPLLLIVVFAVAIGCCGAALFSDGWIDRFNTHIVAYAYTFAPRFGTMGLFFSAACLSVDSLCLACAATVHCCAAVVADSVVRPTPCPPGYL